MEVGRSRALLGAALLCVVSPVFAGAPTAAAPTLRAGALPASLRIDGVIDDSEWAGTDAADDFAQTDPVDGAAPSGRTSVRVLAGAKANFNPALREWNLNVQRRIQRRLETVRWAFPARRYQVTQTSRAGLITELPIPT